MDSTWVALGKKSCKIKGSICVISPSLWDVAGAAEQSPSSPRRKKAAEVSRDVLCRRRINEIAGRCASHGALGVLCRLAPDSKVSAADLQRMAPGADEREIQKLQFLGVVDSSTTTTEIEAKMTNQKDLCYSQIF